MTKESEPMRRQPAWHTAIRYRTSRLLVDPDDRKFLGFDHCLLSNTHNKDPLATLSPESVRWPLCEMSSNDLVCETSNNRTLVANYKARCSRMSAT